MGQKPLLPPTSNKYLFLSHADMGLINLLSYLNYIENEQEYEPARSGLQLAAVIRYLGLITQALFAHAVTCIFC